MDFKIKEIYGGRFEVHASDTEGKYFKMKVEIPEKKSSNQRYLEKQKDKILNMYDKYKEMESILFSMKGRDNEVEQPKYYLDVIGIFRRFRVEKELNFHMSLEQDSNGEPCIHLYYEKYKKKSELWGRTKVATFKYSRKLREELEEALSVEWSIYDVLQQFKEELPSLFKNLGLNWKEREPSWYGHGILEESQSWFLGYFHCEEEEIAIVLKKDTEKNRHEVVFVKEYISSRFRHYMDFKEWFSILYSKDKSIMSNQILKKINSEQQQEVEEQKKKSFLSSIFS